MARTLRSPNLGLENNLGSDTACWFNERFAMSLWGHLEQRFGTERPRKLLALDDEAMAGPVHLIACHRGATESQSLKHLGFPDATVVSTRSWVYVADEVQKIQIVFLANCRDETTTNLALQGFFEWLAQVQEAGRLSERPRRAGGSCG